MKDQSRSILQCFKCKKSAAEPEINILYDSHILNCIKIPAVFKRMAVTTARISLEKKSVVYLMAHNAFYSTVN